jgi:transcriptional regulator GlxA family with amidase domain
MKTDAVEFVSGASAAPLLFFMQPGGGNLKRHVRDYSDGATGKIEDVLQYMAINLDKQLTVSNLAGLARISPSHFFALFKRQTGRAPIEFFIHMKVHRACELLDETSLSIKEIAATLGYDDQFYFSRVFKSVTEFAPTQYRLLVPQARQQIKLGATADISSPNENSCPEALKRVI